MIDNRRLALALLSVSLVLLLACPLVRPASEDLLHVYLTWQGDTSHTMTVNFQTLGRGWDSLVYYDTVSHADTLAGYAFSTRGDAKRIPGVLDGRSVHAVELTGLTAGTIYYFTVGGSRASKEYAFRTCPDDDTPIRFISGGDMGVSPRARRLMTQAGALDPLFAVIGGDIAYANGVPLAAGIWDTWFRNWADCMVTTDGCLIPMVLAIGNHETNDIASPPERRAPFYFGFFPQGGSPYFSRTFGTNLAIFVLDSGHIYPHGGDQADWLADALAAHAGTEHTMAVYHVPLYPSHRDFNGTASVEGRLHWLPLFDAYELDVAFENHDHTHKRTWPLRGDAIVTEGTIYLGDGDFGQDPRTITDPSARYLANASSTPHFWVADVAPGDLDLYAVDEDGDVFDAVP